MLFFTVITFAFIGATISAATVQQKKKDPYDNKGNTPFFLQDPQDGTCLGPNGFTVCDERALWILTRRVDRKNTYSLVTFFNPSHVGMCLEHKSTFFGLISTDSLGMGHCNKNGAKSWEFEFIDKTHVRLSTKGMCLVRGKRKYKTSFSLQNCNRGEYSPLIYHPAEVHSSGFYLKAADGKCFDGSKFRDCGDEGAKNLFGVGIKYIQGHANRYIFNFHIEERNNCIVARGSKVEKGLCTTKGALRWGLRDGQLSIDNGKYCVARLADDRAEMVQCSEVNEYISIELPQVYTTEDLAYMLENRDKLSPEEKKKLVELIKQHSLAKGSTSASSGTSSAGGTTGSASSSNGNGGGERKKSKSQSSKTSYSTQAR